MGERRKRRSLWDKESEMTHFSGTYEHNYWAGKGQHSSHYSGQHREFSASASYRASNFRDKSTEEKPVDPMNGSFNRSRESAPEWKEIGGENKYYQKISPEFKYSHSLGNDRSHSQRYAGRHRSRSRSLSRSRSRGRSRSRSLSRGRERERVRGWNRADHGHISRHSYSSRGSRSELRDNNSDPYQGEDEQFQNRNRGAFPCKDFIKGKCRWGDTCRFSHHFASGGTFGKGTRFLSSDKDNDQQRYKNGTLCKYFAAGKCDLNNCRFSHEDLRFNGLEGREGKVTDDDSFYNKGNKRDGPTWIGTTRTTEDVKPSGWNESIVTVTNKNGDDTNERNGSRWSHSLGNENVKWRIQERNDDSIDWNNRPSPHARSGTYSRELGTGESIGKENMADKQAVLMLHGSQLQNHDGNLNVEGLNRSEVDQQFPMETWHTVSQVSHIQHQAHGIIENKSVSSFRSDVLDGVNETKNAAYPIPVSRQNLSESGETHSIPNITESEPYPNPSNLIADLNLQQSQMRNHQNAMQTTQTLETRVPNIFPNLARNEHSVEFPNPLVSLIGQQVPLIETNNTQSNPISLSHDPINLMEDDRGGNEHVNHTEQGKQMQVERSSPSTNVGVGPGNSKSDNSERSRLEQETVLTNSEADEGKRAIGEESQGVKSNKDSETLESHGKAEESNANKDDKGMRLFKNSLIEFVKDILKPTWKEGRMSREVHKTIVKKVVDKVTSTIQVDHILKTQEKVEQYLSFSKPKIAKLVQAYVGRCLKTDS